MSAFEVIARLGEPLYVEMTPAGTWATCAGRTGHGASRAEALRDLAALLLAEDEIDGPAAAGVRPVAAAVGE
jgi:hypothetical protein